jgi:hypothetical protein
MDVVFYAQDALAPIMDYVMHVCQTMILLLLIDTVYPG